MMIEKEFQNYLKHIYEDASTLPPDMITELRRAFYSTAGLGITVQSQTPLIAGQMIMEIKKVSESHG